MITYVAEVIEKIDNGPGVWSSIRAGVFRCKGETKEQVGEYKRNYPNPYRAFFHFRRSDKDYALYSPEYTVSRIMELPSCKDIGGEEPASGGFCPVDYYVPCYVDREYVDLKDEVRRHRINEPSPEDLLPSTEKYTPLDEATGKRITVEKPSYPITSLLFYPFGFVAGCIWGDDSSWKIQYLDLTEAERGIIKRDERFGYISLPEALTLRQAIDLGGYRDSAEEGWARQITIATQRRFDVKTGETIDEKDW